MIAAASREEQAAVWKSKRPKKGESVAWWEIVRPLDQRRMAAAEARFDEEIATAFGIVWQDDLFAPADQDSRYTTQIEAFLGAQLEWVSRNLPANGVVLEAGSYDEPKLPPRAQRSYAGQERPGDTIGYFVHPRSGAVETIVFEAPVRAQGQADQDRRDAKAERPPVTRKGLAMIGELRTEALHQALREAPIDDHRLLGMLVLALGASNVTVLSGAGERHDGNPGAAIARRLCNAGTLTADPEALREAARKILTVVLSCREDASGSGIAARLAGAAIGADAQLPQMATPEFLACLSRPALEAVARSHGLAPFARVKDTRATLNSAARPGRLRLSQRPLRAQRAGARPGAAARHRMLRAGCRG